MSLTTLYRSSKTASKRAYNAGYASACHDLLNMIQQGVSTEADPSREVTIGRIMDYIEARLEAIKAREEEEDEEEERVTKGVAGPSAPKPKPASPTPASSPVTRREQMVTAPPTPYTPSMLDTSRPYASPALASPTPSVLPLRPMSAPFQSISRASKSRLMPSINPKELSSVPPTPVSFPYDAPAVADVTVQSTPTETSMPLKRRREDASHSGSEAAGTVAGTSRRRTRSNRGENQPSAGQGEAMDVEEEGPQRKRVARR
ncbi:hypothetical protein OH76DRAFT_1410251 [Lentinus brumalis]|uniref:Uncharacterized protein n=1 Tax=Lentinus brumalis TaxID=2498619 RepID=A0A371CSS5_9APHY|nr:hypothetical protein OH76DRAFT_1410251 [Polyporus brumalis]